jgi:hypothetical protein
MGERRDEGNMERGMKGMRRKQWAKGGMRDIWRGMRRR